MRYLSILPIAALLAGCAAPSLYQWGGYDQALYAGYKDPAKMETLRVQLEKHIANMETSKQKVAPGLYAELGTLYLQSGASDKAHRSVFARTRGLAREQGLDDRHDSES